MRDQMRFDDYISASQVIYIMTFHSEFRLISNKESHMQTRLSYILNCPSSSPCMSEARADSFLRAGLVRCTLLKDRYVLKADALQERSPVFCIHDPASLIKKLPSLK